MADMQNAPGTAARGAPHSISSATVPRGTDTAEPSTGGRCVHCGRVGCRPWREHIAAMHAAMDLIAEAHYDAGYRAAEEAMCGAIRESFDPDARTLAEAADTVLRRIDAKRYREQVATREPAPWVPVDWPDAVVRLPGESEQHYVWRCGQRIGGAA